MESPSEAAAEAIARAERHADAEWLASAKAAASELALSQSTFTSDDIWDRLHAAGVTTHEPRALGAVLRALASLRHVRKTGRYVVSRRVACHGRPIPVWESLIFRP